ncbi:primase alpha helix C-terminal domain-containing protein [Aerococcus sp. Group 1]|uniref:primase alpha helix C-terminal domain-containing protein n=1 Tax=Aerococcus urinae (strain CCUG 59500 / ACS-120-V-Col10a) TaxID=2976812 RepID=UPI00227D6064|nr:primase alpha helix C-terminal domain-containing protein [Aerococcus sp. Group 1]MCY3031364.1 primase alpha helix C-terminal domain-containing protein [Aerococcus sp. Group 1]
MIYTTKGVKNNRLEECQSNGSDFETLAYLCENNIQRLEGIQPQNNGDKPVPDEIKLNDCIYFFSGKIKGNKRADSETISKSLITLDIEPRAITNPDSPIVYDYLNFDETIKQLKQELKGLKYIIYPTVNSQPNHARIRVILEPEHSMTKEETASITQRISDHFKYIPIDPSSGNFSRLMGMPVDNGLHDNYKVIVNRDGAKVPIYRPQQQEKTTFTVDYSQIGGSGYIGKVPKLLQEVYSGIPQGERNNFFTKAFGTLLTAKVDPEYCIAICQDWNERFTQPPLSDKELATVMESVLTREEKKRGVVMNE